MFQARVHLGRMSDGSQAALSVSAQACEPSLAGALDALFACAEQGLHPERVLGDIRTLLSSRGLLLPSGVTAGQP